MYPCPLTPRQQQVAGLIAMGFTAPQIGAVLGLTERTANAYTHAIYARWGVNSRIVVLRMIWREELRVEAALRGAHPPMPPTAGEWLNLYWYIIKALACYGIAARQVRASTGADLLAPRDAKNNATKQIQNQQREVNDVQENER
jgi:DNA-binding CsgD family transcriptional regulator